MPIAPLVKNLSDPVMLSALISEDICYRTLGGNNGRCLIGCGTSTKQTGWDGRAWRRDHYSAVLCLSGRATYSHDGGTWPVGPGDLFQRHPDQAHSLHIDCGPWRECWVALGAAFWSPLVECGTISPASGPRSVAQSELWAASVARATTELRATNESSLPRFLPRLASLVTDALARPHRGSHTELIERACVRMGEDPRLDLPALARAGGLSFERFRKLFRAQVGMSPGDYLIQRRIDLARTLLHDPSLSVSEVAEALGYPDAFSFSTQFRKRVGSSPRHWRSRGLTADTG